MEIEFAIKGWAACAPGLTTPSDWLQWASRPVLPAGDGQPPVAQMPPLLRRRLAPLGRMAAQAAYECQGGSPSTVPVVFASRYGDAARSLALLNEFSMGRVVSPTDFALSVHNAIGAVFSIANRDTANYSSVAAGAASAAAGIVEAAGLLADGAHEVLLVCYDAPVPGEYAVFADEPAAAYAWAWRVGPRSPGQPSLSLTCRAANDEAAPQAADAALPFGLDVLRFALARDTVLRRDVGGAQWEWRRHA